MSEAKPFVISRWEVLEAYKRVKANQGAAGVDEQSIADFERNLKGNLYKIWNRMSSAASLDRFYRPVEDLHKPAGIFAVPVAAHGGFVDGDLGAAGRNQLPQLLADHRQQRFRNGPAVGVRASGRQASAQRVGAGDAGLERGAVRREPLQTAEFGYRSQALGSAQFAQNPVFSALIVSRRAEAAGKI